MSNGENQGPGPIIASIIIVALLMTGGYYLFRTSYVTILEQGQEIEVAGGQPAPVITIPAKPPQESTEIADIEADTMAVDTASIDSELENLDLLVQ